MEDMKNTSMSRHEARQTFDDDMATQFNYKAHVKHGEYAPAQSFVPQSS